MQHEHEEQTRPDGNELAWRLVELTNERRIEWLVVFGDDGFESYEEDETEAVRQTTAPVAYAFNDLGRFGFGKAALNLDPLRLFVQGAECETSPDQLRLVLEAIRVQQGEIQSGRATSPQAQTMGVLEEALAPVHEHLEALARAYGALCEQTTLQGHTHRTAVEAVHLGQRLALAREAAPLTGHTLRAALAALPISGEITHEQLAAAVAAGQRAYETSDH